MSLFTITAEDVVAYIKKYFHHSNTINKSTQQRLSAFYGFLSWFIYLVTIGVYLGIFVMTLHLPVPEILFILIGLGWRIFLIPKDNWDSAIYLWIAPIFGLVLALFLEQLISIDPRFVATLLMSVSLMLGSLQFSLILHDFFWIIIIVVLVGSHLSGSTYLVLIVLAAILSIFYPEDNDKACAGGFNFTAILLTWLATDFLMPYIYGIYGPQEDLDFWNNYSQYHFHIQSGVIGMCSFVIYQSRLIVEKRRSTYPDYSYQLLCSFIQIFRLLIEPISWAVTHVYSFYRWTKFSFFAKKFFIMFINRLLVFLEPCYDVFLKYSIMCLQAFIECIKEISRFCEKPYKTFNLVHVFVTIFYIYIIYRIYLFLQ